jgi:hypothetical protein
MSLSRTLNSIKDGVVAGKNLVGSSFSLFRASSTSANPARNVETIELNSIRSSSMGIGTKLIAGSLAFMSYIQQVASSTVYATDRSSQVTYKIDYNANNLPHMYTELLDYCKNFILSPTSTKSFAHAASPFCMKDGVANGPEISVGIEMGKQLMNNFVDCVNDAMQNMCQTYHNKYNWNALTLSEDQIAIISIGAAMILLTGVGCCVIARSSRNNAPPSYDEAVSGNNNRHHNNDDDCCDNSSNCLTTTVVIAKIANNASNNCRVYSHPSQPPVSNMGNNNVSVGWQASPPTPSAPMETTGVSVGWKR